MRPITPGTERRGLTEGDLAWVALLVGVGTYDLWAILTRRETMSSAYWRRGSQSPLLAIALGSCTLGLAWHLLSGGRRRLLPKGAHDAYRKVHPLWRLSDILLTESD